VIEASRGQPHHRVFMRFNSAGKLDCSSTVNPLEGGQVVLPGGWVWERFAVQPGQKTNALTPQLVRRRAGATPRSAV
jgi:hypothetical protein